MKINCGPSYEERLAAKKDWHRWFALIPRRVAPGDCRWLEYIERKGEPYMGFTFGTPFPITKWRFKYRAIEQTNGG